MIHFSMRIPIRRLAAAILLVFSGQALAAAPPSVPVSAAEMETLGPPMTQALAFYLEGKYDQALPLFQEAARIRPSDDLAFWIGASAGRSGRCDLAMTALTDLLTRKPGFLQARIELGIACFTCKDYVKARENFQQILAGSPPPEAAGIAKNYLGRLDRAEQKGRWRLRISQGYQYDSNLNSGPSRDLITDAATDIVLSEEARKQDGGNWLSDLSAGFLYDMGDPGGFFWDSGANLYYSLCLEDSDYTYLNVQAGTGPIWRGPKDRVKLPAGYVYKNYGEHSLSNTVYLAPEWEHFFTDRISASAGYRFSREEYSPKSYSDGGYDNDTHDVTFGSNLYLMDRNLVVSGFFTWQTRNADNGALSYDGYHLGLSAFSRCPVRKTEVYVLYRYSDKDYDSPPLYYRKSREDEWHTFVAVVTQPFMERFFASAELTHVRAGSNLELYDFDKTAFTLSLGVKF